MPREYCSICHYPKKSCVCSIISHYKNKKLCPKARIIILQDSLEARSAKNTARLLPLCIEDIQIFVGKNENDFMPIRRYLNKVFNQGEQVLIVYPNENSQAIERWALDKSNKVITKVNEKLHLVFIDGTWRKAFRLWKINTWLHTYPSVFLRDVESNYRIRKVTKIFCRVDEENISQSTSLNVVNNQSLNNNKILRSSVSTLEALVYSLKIFEPKIDTAIVLDLFDKMQSFFPNE